MLREILANLSGAAPVVMGTGLIALDIVISVEPQHPQQRWVGGTCGNVLTILSALGWQAFPVARLDDDPAGMLVRRDLAQWGVRLDFAALEPLSHTPMIVQHIGRDAMGRASHRFSWRCPDCGSWLPRYRAVPLPAVREVLARMQTPNVFFLDRLSAGALLLARECARRGAVVVFEPAGTDEPRLFAQALTVAHILKYSHERRHRLPIEAITEDYCPFLTIETLGQDGLRYRLRHEAANADGWQYLNASSIDVVRDTAGAGDWCTAGILHLLGRHGLAGLRRATVAQLREAFAFGQELAAWNCGFEGARGSMYAATWHDFRTAVERIRVGEVSPTSPAPETELFDMEPLVSICQACQA